jgi:arylsulfatase A-like enzyme
MDKNIGIMLDELEKRNLRDNTIVIFLSDNGMPFPRAKATLYDFGIRTPLLFNWKDNIPANTNCRNMLSVIDLAPTLLDILQLDIPKEMYGKSFYQELLGNKTGEIKYIFAERNWHDTDAHMRCVRSDSFKLIVNGYPELLFPTTADYNNSGTWWDLLESYRQNGLNKTQSAIFTFPRNKVELYDLKADPLETQNLIEELEYREIAQQLLGKLGEWQKRTNDYPSHDKRRNDIIDRRSATPLLKWSSPYSSEEMHYWE